MHVQPVAHPSAPRVYLETQPRCPFIDHAIIPHSEGSTLVGGQEQDLRTGDSPSSAIALKPVKSVSEVLTAQLNTRVLFASSVHIAWAGLMRYGSEWE